VEPRNQVSDQQGGWRNGVARGRRLFLMAVGLGTLFGVVALLGISRLEESDTFCIACHTAPEVEYFNRSRTVLAGEVGQDLASAHYSLIPAEAKCIDCHRGNGGVVHRGMTLALGARDALIFIAGRSDPKLEKAETQIEAPALLTAACVECHTDTLLVLGYENHFHNKLPEAYAAWKAGGKLVAPAGYPETEALELKKYETTVVCMDCHPAHVTVEGAELTHYFDLENTVYPVCIDCHREVGHAPLELKPR
jgi:Zn finger protein HypA/HybF involved in hydrogenase expression